MKKIEIPVPAIIVGLLMGLGGGLMYERDGLWGSFPAGLIFFAIFGAVVGALLQLIFWLLRRRKITSTAGLENLPYSAGELLREVIGNMKYRRAIREDVMAELARHFEDEFRDCKTEEERNQKAKRIIEEFGDPKLLGILLRRAKKRCRPLWRTAVVRSFQATGILILCFIVWFLTGKPVITTDYVAEYNRLVRPVADESQNALPLYDKAVQLLKGNSDYNDVKELLRKKYEETTADEKGKIEKLIAENKEVFDLIIAGSQKPCYWRTYYIHDPNDSMYGIPLPELAEFRGLALLLRWRARFSAERGRFEDSFNDLTACYRFGRHIRQGNKTLVEQLTGIAIEAISVGTIRDILGEHQIDSSTLKALQENLEQAFANENFVINFTSEKLLIYDAIQRCFTDGAFGSHLYLRGLMSFMSLGMSCSETKPDFAWYKLFVAPFVEPKMTFHVLFTHPGKRESRQQTERFYNYLDNIAHKTPAQIHPERIGCCGGETEWKIVKGNILLEILTPAVGKVVGISYRIKTGVQATVAIIALQRYKQDKGQYPDSLNDLIAAGYLKELPIDPWSDKPLIYRKTESSFTLYSVGLNFKDDGGVLKIDERKEQRIQMWDRDEGDAVFWPAAK